uniref:Uncharacterized protein n=1 Tax=Arundo donax TaxID=35708 RepID=A0A0A9H4K2_ARUDO
MKTSKATAITLGYVYGTHINCPDKNQIYRE